MSKAAHTKGPWLAFTDDSRQTPHTNIVAYNGGTQLVFSLPGRHKSEPDIDLICAAPDLLEALKECVKWIETSAEGDNATRMAFAAIARAKGGE